MSKGEDNHPLGKKPSNCKGDSILPEEWEGDDGKFGAPVDEKVSAMPEACQGTPTLDIPVAIEVHEMVDKVVQSDLPAKGVESYGPTELKTHQLRNTTKITLSLSVHTMGFILIIVTSLNFSINWIVNGSETAATAESQFYFTISVVARELTNIWVGEMHGVLGSWYGRKQVMIIIGLSLACGAAVSIVALTTKFVGFSIISQVFVGFSVCMATAVAYVADASTSDKIWRNNGIIMASYILTGAITMIINAALTNNLYALYFMCVLCGIGSCCASVTLVDLSPQAKLRSPGTKMQLIQILARGPCLSWSTFYNQTAFTRCLLLGMSFNTGSTAAAGAWIVNYTLVQFKFKAMLVNVFIVFVFVGFAAIVSITTPFIKPSRAACILIFGNVVAPIGALIMAFGPGTALVFWLSVLFLIPGAVGLPVSTTILYGQQPSEARGQIVGLHKLVAGICKAIGAVSGGMMTVWWLKMKDEGRDPLIRPPLSTAFLGIVGSVLILISLGVFRHEDKKLYLEDVQQT